MRQYRNDRDPREPLFEFKRRTLVHFAVDTEQVWMTTWLWHETPTSVSVEKHWRKRGILPKPVATLRVEASLLQPLFQAAGVLI
jgi:hypothetical protein